MIFFYVCTKHARTKHTFMYASTGTNTLAQTLAMAHENQTKNRMGIEQNNVRIHTYTSPNKKHNNKNGLVELVE